MSDGAIFWLGFSFMMGGLFVYLGLCKIGEAIQEAIEDESDLSGFYD